jgi:hypothetical protein
MKDLCILETSPSGPIENHKKLFNNYDWFYVSHDSELSNDERCISFNRGFMFSQNRNCLYNYVKTLEIKYKYYMFIDYDVEIKSINTNIDPINQLINDLNEYNPAVMILYDKSKPDYSFIKPNCISNLMFSNNQIKIYHHSIIDYIFEGPSHICGIWDTCHHNNVLEIPFYKYVLCNSKIICSGLISNPKSQPSYYTNKDVIKEMHNYMYPYFSNELQKFKISNDMKHFFLNLSKHISPIKMPHNIDYLKFINVFQYFDPNYPHFNNLRKYSPDLFI